MRQPQSRLGGPRINALTDRLVLRYLEIRDSFIDAMMAEGYPPFTEPLSEREQYQLLVAWRNTGDPRYTQSPAAQHALERLSAQFGAPAPVAPMAIQAPGRPRP